jgi:hypothetical protein
LDNIDFAVMFFCGITAFLLVLELCGANWMGLRQVDNQDEPLIVSPLFCKQLLR